MALKSLNLIHKYTLNGIPREGAGAAGGAGAGAGTGAGDGGAAATATAAAATAAKPWHDGVDAETVGVWSNKGWKVEDPKEVATQLTKSYRELEKHFGVPADQLLKLPKADAKPEDWKPVWQRLGAPAEAKDYDFSAIKFNGQPLEDSFATSMRNALAGAYIPKDKASAIVGEVVKFLETAETQENTIAAGKYEEAKARLAKSWGTNFEYNTLKAKEGAHRLGQQFVSALEKAGVDYDIIFEGMRRIGVSTTEDSFVERGTNSNGVPTTREGVIAEIARLKADVEWGKKWTSGDHQAAQQMDALIKMLHAGDA